MGLEQEAATEPYDTWEEARQAGVAELKRLEPELWVNPSTAGLGGGAKKMLE